MASASPERRAGAPPETALLLCAHGTRGLAGAVSEHVAALAGTGDFARVAACALYGEPRLEAVLGELTANRVRLVPFMMAEGYTLDTLRRRVAAHPTAGRVEIARAVGAHPALSDVIAAKARAACESKDWRAVDTALLLVGHGTTRHAASTATARAHAERLRATGTFAEVASAFLDDVPDVAQAVASLSAPRVVAVGFFTDAGDHGREDVPAQLAACARQSVYAGPVGPDPALRDMILAQALANDGDAAPSVVTQREEVR